MQSTEHSQEMEEHDGFESNAVNGLAMLTLNTTTTEPPPSSAAAHCCTMCGSSVKRRLPSSSFPQEPTPKKQQLTLLTSSYAANKFLPPINSDTASPPSASTPLPILRRSFSDPINSSGTTNPTPPSPQFLNSLSPDNAKTNASATTPSPAKSTASLPPLPRVLRRSVSDPTQSAPRTFSHSPISGELGSELNRGGESPSSKRLKRMKDRMREMIQWWDEVMCEGGEKECGCAEDDNGDFNGANNNKITEDEIAEGTETEEAVSVERTGECLIIHFKCPCNKGYEILLSGKNCYYKLM
ncbi:hypothetical protein HYC85_026100 [Camellia sinensis]|uniref:Uncharacterized protein n=1 Tax=Camellia sinensis TaxID=4442 RepID=A0A7J7G4Q9_CAMSI|nr:hypothetical protein HYC85_026100 [Camellia sinensis]